MSCDYVCSNVECKPPPRRSGDPILLRSRYALSLEAIDRIHDGTHLGCPRCGAPLIYEPEPAKMTVRRSQRRSDTMKTKAELLKLIPKKIGEERWDALAYLAVFVALDIRDTLVVMARVNE